MEVRLIPHIEVDSEKWDRCINSEPFPLIYGNSWYLDMIAHEWDALVLGDYETVMPIPKKKKYGIWYAYRPYGAQQLGVFGKGASEPVIVEKFIRSIPKKYKWVDIYLNEKNLLSNNFKNKKANTNLVIDLSQSYEKIYENYSKRTKRNLKKAKQHTFSQFEHDSPEMLIRLFRENKGKTLKSLTDEHYQKMLHIMHVLLHRNSGFMWNLYAEPNTLIAGVFFARWKGRVYFLFSATNEEGKEKHALTKILDEYFIHSSGNDLIFDFEGSNIKSLAQFYKGFGAQERIYNNIRVNRLGLPMGILQRFI